MTLIIKRAKPSCAFKILQLFWRGAFFIFVGMHLYLLFLVMCFLSSLLSIGFACILFKQLQIRCKGQVSRRRRAALVSDLQLLNMHGCKPISKNSVHDPGKVVQIIPEKIPLEGEGGEYYPTLFGALSGLLGEAQRRIGLGSRADLRSCSGWYYYLYHVLKSCSKIVLFFIDFQKSW